MSFFQSMESHQITHTLTPLLDMIPHTKLQIGIHRPSTVHPYGCHPGHHGGFTSPHLTSRQSHHLTNITNSRTPSHFSQDAFTTLKTIVISRFHTDCTFQAWLRDLLHDLPQLPLLPTTTQDLHNNSDQIDLQPTLFSCSRNCSKFCGHPAHRHCGAGRCQYGRYLTSPNGRK